ncbi:hypothetical protein EGI16_04705 [Chryseobacterium sp. G0240]|uniref:hypothetical protein n=1 Tax=Chryseobacterium sp. G0240 TaxID=2487066 RepID=UPI000F454CFC|nr:hypothetical protein [Chryseobacterium sp. G0240]ROI05686.1 hypothetical protein EGI16_04705 [Chryseobacterium sp. G0240]
MILLIIWMDFQYRFHEVVQPCLWCKTSVAFEKEAYKEAGEIIDPGKIIPEWLLDFVPTAEGFYSFFRKPLYLPI